MDNPISAIDSTQKKKTKKKKEIKKTNAQISTVKNDILSTLPSPENVVDNPKAEDSVAELPLSDPFNGSNDREKIFESNQIDGETTNSLDYKEDQQSPVNKEGRKMYDREFLLSLQFHPICLRKPNTLPKLSAPREETERKSKKKKSKRFYEKKAFSPIIGDVELLESDNAWLPSYKMGVVADSLKLRGKVRSLLNKLTAQNFDILAKQGENLVINTEEELNIVTDVIIEQFNKEEMFRELYAKLCKYLSLISVPLNDKTIKVQLKQILIIKCLRELKQEKTDELQKEQRIKIIGAVNPEIGKLLQTHIEEEERKIKRKKLGNIIFMSELFKLNMLTEPVMHECIEQLLCNGDKESLDCLCCVLKEIGKELDKKETDNSDTIMDKHFAQIKNVIFKKLVKSRICFKLKNLIDIRQNNWVFKREENNL